MKFTKKAGNSKVNVWVVDRISLVKGFTIMEKEIYFLAGPSGLSRVVSCSALDLVHLALQTLFINGDCFLFVLLLCKLAYQASP